MKEARETIFKLKKQKKKKEDTEWFGQLRFIACGGDTKDFKVGKRRRGKPFTSDDNFLGGAFKHCVQLVFILF